jgi:hypothetical protein
MAVNVNNPLLPDSCARFGMPGDSLGTWGVGRYKNQIYLSYIYAVVPFYANWGGTKILSYDNNCSTTGFRETFFKEETTLFPNPVNTKLTVKENQKTNGALNYKIFNALGEVCSQGEMQNELDVSMLKNGFYTLLLYDRNGSRTCKFVKE